MAKKGSAKVSRSARKAQRERATRAREHGLPPPEQSSGHRPAVIPRAPRAKIVQKGASQGAPTILKVAIGAFLALGVVFLLSLLRR